MRYSTKKTAKVFTARKMSIAVAAMLLGAVCMSPRGGMAQVAGDCVNCHTMHNSQGGVNMSGTTTVYRSLTKGDCVGCHTGAAGDVVTNNIPKVNHTGDPGTTILAGGSFYWVADAGGNTDAKGHNVLGVAGADAVLANIPPGGSELGSQLTCAGTVGCHGNRAVADQYSALGGSHHAPPQNSGGISGAVDGSSLANSYRFLNTIKGTEDSDWENGVTAAAHNQYYGVDKATDSAAATGTISSLCG
ncbi:MAG: hypothetical protein V1782_07965, partial [Pseudomonadota bacterium]